MSPIDAIFAESAFIFPHLKKYLFSKIIINSFNTQYFYVVQKNCYKFYQLNESHCYCQINVDIDYE